MTYVLTRSHCLTYWDGYGKILGWVWEKKQLQLLCLDRHFLPLVLASYILKQEFVQAS